MPRRTGHSPLFAIRYSLLALLLAACGGAPQFAPPGGLGAEQQANLTNLMRLDANGDGLLDRVELDNGLRQEYMRADRDRDGRLSPAETSDENVRRWQAEGPAATPLIDWNQDGVVDFLEFANAVRGLFDSADRDRSGSLSRDELVIARRPGPPPGGGPPPRGP
jgi:hypothetical protein